MSKFRKKPVVIDAFVWSPNKPATEGPDWFYSACKARNVYPQFDGTLAIQTLEGVMIAQPGDYVIRGIKGELYPCKPDIFEATYEPVATGRLSIHAPPGSQADIDAGKAK